VKRRWQQEEHALRRLSIEEICAHVEFNSYTIFIGRSLTRPGSPAVPITTYERHFKFIGASQKGKSSMAAAFLEIITRTHDPEHVILALLDLEDQTSKLFADKPHIAELLIDDKPLLLHAHNREQVVEYLNHIVALMDYRYSLSKHEVIDGPILLVYIEEFLALKKYLRKKIDAAPDREAERKAKKLYADFTYAISEIASRGLKVRIQLLLCAQVDYRDEDKELQEALINVDAGMSFCVRPTAAQAAGFYHNELLNRNYEDDKVGQAVVEMSDCKDLVLAPQFDLEQKLLDLEAIHHSPAQYVSERKNASVKPVNVNRVNAVNEHVKGGEDTENGREHSPEPVNIPPAFTSAEEVQVLLAYADMLKSGKPVTRTGIRDQLGWNNKQYERVIKPVCDTHKIG
jgi:FtsK/SpoIIIE family